MVAQPAFGPAAPGAEMLAPALAPDHPPAPAPSEPAPEPDAQAKASLAVLTQVGHVLMSHGAPSSQMTTVLVSISLPGRSALSTHFGSRLTGHGGHLPFYMPQITLLAAALVIGHILERRKVSVLGDSAVALLLGLIAGVFFYIMVRLRSAYAC